MDARQDLSPVGQSDRIARLEAALAAALEVDEIRFRKSQLGARVANTIRHAIDEGVALEECAPNYQAVVRAELR